MLAILRAVPNAKDIHSRRRHVINDHVRINDDQFACAVTSLSAAFWKFGKAQRSGFYPFSHASSCGRVKMTDIAANIYNIGDSGR